MASVPLLTHARLRALCPDPPATVQIRNLSTTIQQAGHDAWNRAGKPQPCLLSAEVAFASAFDAAAADDRLGADTVHYGTLSKAVLACVGEFEARAKSCGARWEVADLLARVWLALTGVGFDGRQAENIGNGDDGKEEPVLDLGKVRLLSVTVALPKASLLGEGVKLTASAVFDAAGTKAMEARAMAMEVARLRVPTLIGVNDNERLAKQFVVATVTVERFTVREDVYSEIEGRVVKALEESSYETLEALGAHLAEHVFSSRWREDTWQVCIRMEKPTAVPMADCPIVEVRATPESLAGKGTGPAS